MDWNRKGNSEVSNDHEKIENGNGEVKVTAQKCNKATIIFEQSTFAIKINVIVLHNKA